MAIILCLETATDVCSVAISDNGEVHQSITIPQGLRHSSELVPMIDRCLSQSSIGRDRLDAIAISNGPGSYTGLRVGASTAKAISYTLAIPLLALPTLQCLADPYRQAPCVVISTLDARRMEAYIGIYKDGHELTPVQSVIWSQTTMKELSDTYGQLLICGNGIAKAVNEFILPPTIDIQESLCDAAWMCRLAEVYYSEGCSVDIAYHTPFYYKGPNITAPRRR